MSLNGVFFNFFFRNNHNTKISTQQLFIIYSLFIKYQYKLTFSQFYTYFTLFRFNFIKIGCNRTYLILGYMFFLKTFQTKRIVYLSGLGDVTSAKNTILGFTISNDVFNFWRIFQKLKRPETKLSYSEFYIAEYKSKLDKYSKFGFLVLLDSMHVIRSRSEIFLRNFVKVNKTLLLTPKYSSSSINKYLGLESLQKFEFQFLRKNKVYNKGRYSRCRQNYRTGVYMCMYLSVVSIFGLYYWFYKFSFNFTYLWWLFIFFVSSFFLPKIIKYRFYEPATLFLKFFDFFKWVFLIIKSLLK